MSKTRAIEAVKALDLKAAKALISRDASLLGVKNHQGRNLLHLACGAPCHTRGVPEAAGARMVAFLLDSGMDVHEKGLSGRDPCTPIWFAVAFGRNRAVVRLLLARGAVPTGLFAAGWLEDTAMLRILLAAGAPVDTVEGGLTPFLECWGWRRFKAVKFFAMNGANLDFQNRKGRTALHLGIERDYDPALLSWLVSRGASADIPDVDGVTARERAARKRDTRYRAAIKGRRRTR